jgi:LPXTG-site transpeptidase (sortase) family protein
VTGAASRPPRSAGRGLAGGALLVTGIVLVTFAGTRYADGAVKAAAVRDEWQAAQVRNAVEQARRGVFSTVAGAGFERGAPVARLRVPRIGLDEIVVEGVGDAELNVGPGHVPGSALPGEPGNAVISAHRDRHFADLGTLAVGDTVVTELGHAATRWVVVSRRILEAGEPALFATDTPTLTLTTCWPIRYFGPAPERLIITARPLSGAPVEDA